jgi:steroid delta-isomerase-like uncharacterized protein
MLAQNALSNQNTVSNQNKLKVKELFAAWHTHDVAGVVACISESCNSGGKEGIRRELEVFFTAFPDLELTLEDILAEENKVATRVTMRGTQQGTLMGIPATGKSVVVKANHLFTLENGLIIARYGQMDRLELMQQLGMKLVSA